MAGEKGNKAIKEANDAALGAAYEEYYRSGEMANVARNKLMEAILYKLMGFENVENIKKKVDSEKKAGLDA